MADLATHLLERAEGLTLKRLKREGELLPGVLLYAKARGSLVVPLPWRSPDEKVGMLDALRAMMAAAGVEAYAIWSECWMSVGKIGESVDLGALTHPEVMPRDDPNHIDVVVIIAAEKGKSALARAWEIKKDAKGRVRLAPMAGGADVQLSAGRLGELLPGPGFDA